MTRENERKNGGLIALTVSEALILEEVLGEFTVWDEDPERNALLDRLIEWRRRHTPEDAS